VALNEILISNLPVTVAADQLTEYASRFLLPSPNANNVGEVVIATPSDPNASITTAVISCDGAANAESVVNGINSLAKPFHGMVLIATQGS
jgi:hypothetical protein